MPDNEYDSRTGAQPQYGRHAAYTAAVNESNERTRPRTMAEAGHGLRGYQAAVEAAGYRLSEDGYTIDLPPDSYQQRQLIEQEERRDRQRAAAAVDWDARLIRDVARAMRYSAAEDVASYEDKRAIVYKAVHGTLNYRGDLVNGNRKYFSVYAWPEELEPDFVLETWEAARELNKEHEDA